MKIKYSNFYIWFKSTSLYLSFLRTKAKYKDVLVSNDSLVVIEGFPRSANTFAYNLFEFIFDNHGLNPKYIAHHTHSSAQIIFANKYNIPSLVLIRDPLSAVRSLIIMQNLYANNYQFYADFYLKMYISFYAKILPIQDDLLIVDFNDIINNYDLVISKFNSFYNYNYTIPDVSSDFTTSILTKIKNNTLKSLDHDSKKLSIPSKEKSDFKSTLNPYIINSKYYSSSLDIYNKVIKTL